MNKVLIESIIIDLNVSKKIYYKLWNRNGKRSFQSYIFQNFRQSILPKISPWELTLKRFKFTLL
jgi:hypothetical protein